MYRRVRLLRVYQQVSGNLSVFFHVYVCFLWEEGDGNINGDDSPVFCDCGAERAFHPFPSLGACIQNKKWGEDEKMIEC